GFGVHLFGHSPDFINHAIEDQLKRGFAVGAQTGLAGEVAELICELTGLERVNFCNTGSEAVMGALRLARTVTRRDKIAIFAGSYEGITGGRLVRREQVNGKRQSLPVALGIPANMARDVVVLDYDRMESVEFVKANIHDLAAVLVEPVQSARPDLQPQALLQELRGLTDQGGAALIFDEMITGFRVHPGG